MLAPTQSRERGLRILLIDDHAVFREGLKAVLRGFTADTVLDEAGDSAQALERAAQQGYDLVLLDLDLPGRNGLAVLGDLREALAATPVVIVSGSGEAHIVRQAIERGAMGFIPKTSTQDVLVKALHLVLAGGVYLPPAVLDNTTAPAPALAAVASGAAAEPALGRRLGLTPRQADVLRCVVQGKPNKVIARELDISEGTVKAHLSLVMQALGAHNRTEAVYAAAKLGVPLV